MNDRLKYKVFDKRDNKLKEIKGYTFSLMELEDLVAIQWTNGLYEGAIPLEDLIFCQCTGLNDRNGKLIYEGDIIVIPNQYPFYDYKNKDDNNPNLNETYGGIKGESILNYVGIVERIYSSWQYVYHCVNPQKRGINNGINNYLEDGEYEDGENTDYEIIGNIYTTPELLEEKE